MAQCLAVLKRVVLSMLALTLLLLVGGAAYVYIGMKPYRQLVDSWMFKENQNGSVIGDLGGIPVAIPHHFARFVEYEGDPHFLEPRKGSPPTRTSQSKLRSFGFEVRFPDMAGLTDATREEKRQSNIFNTMWMSVGVSVESYHDDLSLRRILDGTLSRKWDASHSAGDSPEIWKDKHGYKPSTESLYGLVVNEVTGYDEAKRYKFPGVDTGDANIYYHLNNQRKVDTYIRCSNIKHHAAPCEQDFILPTVKNTMVKVLYRIGFLPQWREIQDSVSKVILGFADDTSKNSNHKITNKPLTPSGD